MSDFPSHVSSRPASASLVEEAVRRLSQRFSPMRIVVFGSYGRGTPGPDSDLDLLLVLAEVSDPREVAIEARRTLADFPVPKDIVITTPAEIAHRQHSSWHIVGRALREGRVVYERSSP